MTPMRNWSLARRSLLKALGLGAAGLPLLHATQAKGQTRPPRRLFCVVAINGYRQQFWKPAPGPLTGPLPRSCGALDPYKSELIFATDLTDSAAADGSAYGTILWGLPNVTTGPYPEPEGATLDVMAGEGRRPLAPLTNLTVGVQLAATTRGARVCSWKGPGQPLVPDETPLTVYQRLFGSPSPGATDDTRRLILQRKSILDYVGGSLKRFASLVGSVDRHLIEGHMESVRNLERELRLVTPSESCGATSPTGLNPSSKADYEKILDAQLSLIVAGLACGATRVATLQLADAVGASTDFGFATRGPSASWKDLAHTPVQAGVDRKQLLDQWWMDKLGDLIKRMKAVIELDGSTLFDNSVVLWANTMQDGANHDAQHLPWLLAGRCGGALKTGQSAATAGTPSSGVLAALATALMAPNPFGLPTPGLLA